LRDDALSGELDDFHEVVVVIVGMGAILPQPRPPTLMLARQVSRADSHVSRAERLGRRAIVPMFAKHRSMPTADLPHAAKSLELVGDTTDRLHSILMLDQVVGDQTAVGVRVDLFAFASSNYQPQVAGRLIFKAYESNVSHDASS